MVVTVLQRLVLALTLIDQIEKSYAQYQTDASGTATCRASYDVDPTMCDNCTSYVLLSLSLSHTHTLHTHTHTLRPSCSECLEFCTAVKQIEQCPRKSIGAECFGLDSTACAETECCICNYCEPESSGICPTRSNLDLNESPSTTDCLSWYSRAGMCYAHMYEDRRLCDHGDIRVPMQDDPGVCYCNSTDCNIIVNSSDTTLTDFCGENFINHGSCETVVPLQDGTNGSCVFTTDKCINNPCTLLGDTNATCTNSTDASGNTEATCHCSTNFTLSRRGSPICERSFCSKASTSRESIQQNNMFFDCFMTLSDFQTVMPRDSILDNVLFSYYLGCGLLENDPIGFYNETKGCCEWGQSCEDCSACDSVSGYNLSPNVIITSTNAKTNMNMDTNYSCDTNPLEMFSYLGANKCDLSCDIGYVGSTDPYFVCNVTSQKVQNLNFTCEPEKICTCSNGTCVCSSYSSLFLSFHICILSIHIISLSTTTTTTNILNT